MGIALAERAVADKYLELEDRRIGYIGFLLCRLVLSYSSVLLRLSALLSRLILRVLSSVLLNRLAFVALVSTCFTVLLGAVSASSARRSSFSCFVSETILATGTDSVSAAR